MTVPDVPEATESPGAKLRAAREARGLTVDEVAGRLRLRRHLIEALERDDLAALGTGPYGRGQLRNYARLVGVPEEGVIGPAKPGQRAASAMHRGRLRRPSLVRRPRSRWPLRALTGVVFGIVGVLAIIWALGTGREEDALRAANEPSPAPLPAAPPPPPRATLPFPPPVPGVQVEPLALPPAQPAAADAAAPTAAPGAAVTGSARAELAVQFTGPCWVEVNDAAGARLLYRMARAGDRHVLSGSPPFTVMLGNAPAAAITYNGAPFPMPDSAQPVVRLTIGG